MRASAQVRDQARVRSQAIPSVQVEGGFQGKRVLVTGGLGFIDSNLAMRVADLGASVVLVDSPIPEYGGNLANIDGYSGRVRLNVADVRDEQGVGYTDLETNCRSQLALLEMYPELSEQQVGKVCEVVGDFVTQLSGERSRTASTADVFGG